ncbi:hypothetical protein IQ291_37060 [Burkholderia sp. R-70211]|nr:hypothetical protein [Burkholderia sp. R-70211]
MIWKIEERVFAYLDSLTEDKRGQLKKSSRKRSHRDAFAEYKDRKEWEHRKNDRLDGAARDTEWHKERGRRVAQIQSTQLMLDCRPTTARASELATRKQHADRFLTWAKEPAEAEAIEARRIEEFVEAVWQAQSGYRNIVGQAAHQTALQQLRQRHFFPDLIELIGEAQASHHHPDGTLTTERKRQLLLLGIFEWRGMLLTYERFRSPDGWRIFGDFTWCVATSCAFPRVRPFRTIADILPSPLTYEWQLFGDACRTYGISYETRSSKGLPRSKPRVQCEQCGNVVFSDVTRRVSVGRGKKRLCLPCYKTLRIVRTLKDDERSRKPLFSKSGRKKFWA